MNWLYLINMVGREAVFSSSLLLSGDVSAAQVRLQLSRWVKSGRLLQLRRGLYALAPAWCKVEPHPFLVANRLQRGSYVSLQSALAFHGVIPEEVKVITSVGPGRPETLQNALGTFQFRRLAAGMLFGYSQVEVSAGQLAFLASAEKALLDLAYFTPGADSPQFLGELRLQYDGPLNMRLLRDLAERSGKPKLVRTASAVEKLAAAEEGETL